MTAACAGCGGDAKGYARIGDDRYCHGDGDAHPTCYQRAQWDMAFGNIRGLPLAEWGREFEALVNSIGNDEAAPTREG